MPDSIKVNRPVPLKYPITARFGDVNSKYWSTWHRGVDLAAPVGTDCLCAMSGRVQLAGVSEKYGARVWIMSEHPQFGLIRCLYAHLDSYSVEEGDKVNLGQLVGKTGQSGNAHGPHIHFEVRRMDNDEPLRPIFYEELERQAV